MLPAMHLPSIRYLLPALLLSAFVPSPVQSAPAGVETHWRLLDYIAVDYPEAVRDGRIVDAEEYEEMIEYSRSAREGIAALPANPRRAELERMAQGLEALIARRASPEEVARAAREIGGALIAAYPVEAVPSSLAGAVRAAQLYRAECAACHGERGDGNGPLARNMEPAPIAFTDRDRAQERSIFALYQVTTQGLDGTAMQSFAHLSPEERWSLSFLIGAMAFRPEEVEAGRRIWETQPELRRRITLDMLVGSTPSDFAREFGGADGAALMAFLRSHPHSLMRTQDSDVERPGGERRTSWWLASIGGLVLLLLAIALSLRKRRHDASAGRGHPAD